MKYLLVVDEIKGYIGESREIRGASVGSVKDETETRGKVMFIDPDMCCSLG